MRRTIATFSILLIIFFGSWGIKAKMPIDRPENMETGSTVPWYMSDYSSPTVEDEWILDPTIPDNYVPVPGEYELYMIVDTEGNITGYKQRTLLEDGTWAWEDVNPDIPNNYELVEGSDNLYKVTDENGYVFYYLYQRNDDNTYAFVACDEFGVPYFDGEDAEIIASNFIHEDGNIYSVYNDNGVKEGYAERIVNDDGKYVWKVSDGVPNITVAEMPTVTTETYTTEDFSSLTTETHIIQPDITDGNKVYNQDGTYTTTSTSTNTVTENGYNIIYETKVINTYDKDGNLIFTKKEGPTELSRTPVTASQDPDISLIKDTVDEEYQRVSSLVSYNTELANSVLALLNAERANQGLSPLTMSTDSEAYKVACIRAGDMATYNYVSSTSPMYGTLDDMVSRWGLSTANASENVWKAGNKSAEDIHSRFQAYDGSRNVRMSGNYTEVGIAIVSKDGQLYIAEIYLK